MSGYIGTQPVPQATQTRDAFTATSGQTSFATSGYTPSFLDVFLNGVKLSAADYTASNGSDVVLASGAATGDILEVVAYTTFEVVTDTLTNAGTVLNLDRTGSDGTILDLKKDSSSVGSIGSEGGSGFDAMYVANGDTGLIFQGYANDAIIPFTAASLDKRDAAIDLGYSAGRFKDLYLSGGVYLGGTGSANKLDDYEEGTWTPELAGSTTAGTQTYFGVYTNGRYRKVGSLVVVSGQVNLLAFDGSTAGDLHITNLPFTPVMGTNVSVPGVASYANLTSPATDSIFVLATNALPYLRLRVSNLSGNGLAVTASNASNYTGIGFSVSYYV
jgi:hypothetical protein